MKPHLIAYTILILLYFAYNQFFRIQDPQTNDLINIVFASFLFLYIAYIAFIILKRLKDKK
ncbi:hypothetical protein ATB99_11085 [Elizabethkingia meningoseptica]|uniref:hypothetical protein n=1 Tax=Elizabethkingia meningoseptica TaxID=238 RepID=UPI000332D40F|nr:hypothetical protein [Elizabethkingia meningoseptica]AQX06905.1 hypothetical protein BBD33_17275 [Elizabethkingia meningoseptica]AQX48951.1 hypothetical protein B5G46_17260 [Elizabethkingia meningoseptica]EOR29845.1 hypothetical protein L100_09369 [Elizabethkingia meningoseptica ATCC 13253 = NBRC 12535]KUY15037.1 hypothetical protein ATB99_11085 [Elizabethkingia meningoseptica]OPB69592.1 hypothetical protein BAY30_05525 [Elizabethkingia meningoseptica]